MINKQKLIQIIKTATKTIYLTFNKAEVISIITVADITSNCINYKGGEFTIENFVEYIAKDYN